MFSLDQNLSSFPFLSSHSNLYLSWCVLLYGKNRKDSSSPASLVITQITLLLSSSCVSSFPGFRRPVAIMHDLREYWSASSSCWDNMVLTFLATASSPSIAETVRSSLSSLSKSSSMKFCCFWIKFDYLASLACCCISLVDGCFFWWQIGLAVVMLLTLPGVVFLWFFWFLVMIKS